MLSSRSIRIPLRPRRGECRQPFEPFASGPGIEPAARFDQPQFDGKGQHRLGSHWLRSLQLFQHAPAQPVEGLLPLPGIRLLEGCRDGVLDL